MATDHSWSLDGLPITVWQMGTSFTLTIRAFSGIKRAVWGAKEIAAQFGVTAQVVCQRMRIAILD